MLMLGLAIGAVGLVLNLVFSIWLLVKAFQQSLIWGLVTLLVPGGVIIFLAVHWDEAWKPFVSSLGAVVMVVVSLFLLKGEVEGGRAPAWMSVPGLQKVDSEPAPDLMKLRTENADLSSRIDKETARLQQVYTVLNEKRSKLDSNNLEAVTAFNAEAAAYKEAKIALEGQRAKLVEKEKELQAAIDSSASKGPKLAQSPPPAPVLAPTSVPATKAPPAQPGTPPQVIMFMRPGFNPAVMEARAYLAGRRIIVREVDVDSSEAATQEWKRYGGDMIPIIVVNGTPVKGFLRGELDRLLPKTEEF